MNELGIVQAVNQFGLGTFIDSISILISSILFITVLWIVLTLLAVYFDKKNRWKVVLAVFLALSLHFLLSEFFIKNILTFFFDLRIRPFLVNPNFIVPLGQQFFDSSFPSSHMASTLAVLTVFVYYYRKTLIPAVLFTLLMGFSRIHNGFHYPTDVLAGAVLGIGYGIVAVYLSREILDYFIKNKSAKKKKSPHTR